MPGFNKLVPEIVDSSIWNESSDVRVVWITMLAIKDENGFVRGDTRSLARRANVPLESVESALECFTNPDPSSHTPDNEGRRISRVDGGWMVLNNDKYREIGMSQATKEYWREQKRKQRHVQDISGKVPDSYVSVSVSDSDPEGSAEGRPFSHEIWEKARQSVGMALKDAEECWAHYDTQGWVLGNGMKITGDPRSLMTRWLANPKRNEQPKGKKLDYAP